MWQKIRNKLSKKDKPKEEEKKFCKNCKIKIKNSKLFRPGGIEYEDGYYCYDCHRLILQRLGEKERIKLRQIRLGENYIKGEDTD
jgi:superfamily II helicase